MSENNEADTTTCCASCGITEIDDVKLKECGDCDLVRYCSDECKENHRSEHEVESRKRAAELRDELLFKQPESNHFGDCPICCLPISSEHMKSSYYDCCSKSICNGCVVANTKREVEMRLQSTCPFCREIMPKNKEEAKRSAKYRMKRVEVNDPVAIRHEGLEKYHDGDHIKAFEHFTKAAELGDAEAHYKLSGLYHLGHGVEKDKGKEIFHQEEAAIGGHPIARLRLSFNEVENRNVERAVKHWIIAATQGQDESIKMLMTAFQQGFISKDILATTLRAHKTAVDATKSPQREAAEKYFRNM